MSQKPAISSWIRWPTMSALLVAAAAHVPVIPEHLREAPYMGWLFVFFTVVAVVAAAMVGIAGAAPAPFIGAGLVSSTAIVAYLLTRIVAFPQLADDVGNWTEPLGIVSIVSEGLALLLSVIAARKVSVLLEKSDPTGRSSRRTGD